MTDFAPKNPDYEARLRESFACQSVMITMGASIQDVRPGIVELSMDHHPGLTQQHGFLHAGVVTTVLDSACGYAGFSLMPADAEVLTVEFKTNFLAPARGERFRMIGTVLKPGRSLFVTEGRAYAVLGGQEKLIATMTCTLMAVTGRSDIKTAQ